MNEMDKKFDMNILQKRISEVKKESNSMVEFYQDFIECLIIRHDLANVIQHYKFDTPLSFSEMIVDGVIPSREQLLELSDSELDFILKNYITFCGLSKIKSICVSNNEDGIGLLAYENICAMMGLPSGYQMGCVILCATTLLFSKIPSFEIISKFTNNFDSSEGGISHASNYLNEVCGAILCRYREDKKYYG